MDPFTASVWLVLALGVLLANLPFFTRRLFGIIPLRNNKGILLRLVELLLYYVVLSMTGTALENNLGQVHTQNWEFYAITLTLFFTLAFPGYVYRYLRRDGKSQSG